MVAKIYAETFEIVMAGATELDFRGLFWEGKDAEVLGRSLVHCKSLQRLSLNVNNFDDTAAKEFQELIPKLPTLYGLDLRVNVISEQWRTTLRQAWKDAGKQDVELLLEPQWLQLNDWDPNTTGDAFQVLKGWGQKPNAE